MACIAWRRASAATGIAELLSGQGVQAVTSKARNSFRYLAGTMTRLRSGTRYKLDAMSSEHFTYMFASALGISQVLIACNIAPDFRASAQSWLASCARHRQGWYVNSPRLKDETLTEAVAAEGRHGHANDHGSAWTRRR